MDELNLNDVRVFARVIESGGFSAAARALRVSKSSVSRCVARLEDQLGVLLVQRTPRATLPTAAGRRYFEQISPALETIRDASTRASERDAPRGLVRIGAPQSVGSEALPELIARFVALYSEVRVEVELTAGSPSMIDEGIDLAIRGGPQPDSSLISRALGGSAFRLYASPAYLARAEPPRRPEQLGSHECLLFRAARGQDTWQLEGPRGPVAVAVSGRIASNELSFIRRAAIAGAGIALLPEAPTSHAVARGLLIPNNLVFH